MGSFPPSRRLQAPGPGCVSDARVSALSCAAQLSELDAQTETKTSERPGSGRERRGERPAAPPGPGQRSAPLLGAPPQAASPPPSRRVGVDRADSGRQFQAGKGPEEWVAAGGRRRGGARGERSGVLFAARPGVRRPRGVGEMAARSLGCGIGRLLGSLPGRAGSRGWPLRGVSALRTLASGPPGSAPAAVQSASYPTLRVQAAQQPAAFWGPLARDTLVWDTPYHTVWDCDFSSGKIGWFLGGQLNVSGEWATGTQGASNLCVQRGTQNLTGAEVRGGSQTRGPRHPRPRHPRPQRLQPSLPLQSRASIPSSPETRSSVSSCRLAAGLAPAGSCTGGLSSLNTGLHRPAERKPAGSPGRHLGQAGVDGAGRPLIGTSLLLSPGPEAKLKSIWLLSTPAACPAAHVNKPSCGGGGRR